MISSEEKIIFLSEIQALLDEYDRCNDIQIKEQINNDIQLIKEVIDQFDEH